MFETKPIAIIKSEYIKTYVEKRWAMHPASKKRKLRTEITYLIEMYQKKPIRKGRYEGLFARS